MIIIVTLMVSLSLACSVTGLIGADAQVEEEENLQSEMRCGDGVCDGPENLENCLEDCGDNEEQEASDADPLTDSSGRLLFQLVENQVSSFDLGEQPCYSFNLASYGDAGYVNVDGSDYKVLEMEGYPTHSVTSGSFDNFFYISTPTDPARETHGFTMMDWDAPGQALYSASFSGMGVSELVQPREGTFPGGVTAAPGNFKLVYLMTEPAGEELAEGMAAGFNPFVSDSSLFVMNPSGENTVEVLPGTTNRRLFTGMADFSEDGSMFYTMAREGQGFRFVRVDLEDGGVEELQDLYPGFPWNSIPWDEFFPRANDFAYASFTMSPDETRLFAYKNDFIPSMDDPCITAAEHRMWVFDFEDGSLDELPPRTGYVSGTSWKPDSTMLAAAVLGNSGCYPDYMDAEIRLLADDGAERQTVASEPKSKITNVIWSPDGQSIAYDVYNMDFVGRLKLVEISSGSVEELVSTRDLGVEVDRVYPVVLMLADWMGQD